MKPRPQQEIPTPAQAEPASAPPGLPDATSHDSPAHIICADGMTEDDIREFLEDNGYGG